MSQYSSRWRAPNLPPLNAPKLSEPMNPLRSLSFLYSSFQPLAPSLSFFLLFRVRISSYWVNAGSSCSCLTHCITDEQVKVSTISSTFTTNFTNSFVHSLCVHSLIHPSIHPSTMFHMVMYIMGCGSPTSFFILPELFNIYYVDPFWGLRSSPSIASTLFVEPLYPSIISLLFEWSLVMYYTWFAHAWITVDKAPSPVVMHLCVVTSSSFDDRILYSDTPLMSLLLLQSMITDMSLIYLVVIIYCTALGPPSLISAATAIISPNSLPVFCCLHHVPGVDDAMFTGTVMWVCGFSCRCLGSLRQAYDHHLRSS
jgi:hypothetical protein